MKLNTYILQAAKNVSGNCLQIAGSFLLTDPPCRGSSQWHRPSGCSAIYNHSNNGIDILQSTIRVANCSPYCVKHVGLF